MTKYRMARKEERDDYVDLANYTFGFDIETLLPKVYHEEDRSHEITMVAEDEAGRLVAEAAVLPQTLHVAGKTLRSNYLGIMVVHHRHRGEGYMKGIMRRCLKNMEGKVDLSVLSGRRQRYEYFGYTSGGVHCRYTINQANVRYALRKVDHREIRFVPFENSISSGVFVLCMNAMRPAYVDRSDGPLGKILTCYHQTPYLILSGNQKLGFLLNGKNGTEISELALQNSRDVGRVIKAYFEAFAVEKVTVTLPEYEVGLHREFSTFAETYEVTPADMFRIFDFANVLEAYLTLKYNTIGISPGHFSAVMDGQPLTITVDQSGVHVERRAEPEAVCLNRMDAQKLILTPYGRYMNVSVPRDWFPLPLFWYAVDSF